MEIKSNFIKGLILFCLSVVFINNSYSQKLIPVAKGWAANSVNVVIFRKNSLVTEGNVQYLAFYDSTGYVVLGKRKLNETNWFLRTTSFRGNLSDAHNSISIMVDGAGYLHLSWDHHNNPLNYSVSTTPHSLEMTGKLPMTGLNESRVSYPEFYRLPNGNLIFLYRDGASGNGNLVINRYDRVSKKWSQLHNNLIDGEKKRNAYWQACIDKLGTIHLSWVWRETPDVASNHDLCYAKSTDEGISWSNSSNEKYVLPVNASTAEYALKIAEGSELINQTSMTADEDGHPFIAGYWREADQTVPQYHVLFRVNNQWQSQNLAFRKTSFSLSGTGTKRIPISRPQILAWKKNKRYQVALIFRDAERESKASIAVNRDILNNNWIVSDISSKSLGAWEPTYDTELWKVKKKLHLFVQYAEQADAEGKTSLPPQLINILEYKKGF